ncbi:outer membrane beta-barrel protein [Shinella sp. BYT-45]|uniref:outer membrane beta-barrel protein n=1 Tax=Shinella sp. BYT-45 TaxID=3377377 RepID=UPI003980C0A6
MRPLHGLLCALFALAACNPANADSTLDYSLGGGRTSNVFRDTTGLASPFSEGKIALRGSLALEDSRFAYGLTASVRRIARYRFADERKAGVEIGYARDLGEAVELTLKAGIEHRRDGDLFLALPGLLIGYRKADIAAAASAGLAVEHWDGKSRLTAALSNLDRGKADFTLRGLPRLRLEAGNRLFELTGGHIRPLLGGEVGATLQYRTNRIPADDRERFERLPARTLRGSLAYGRALAGGVTLMAEAGIVGVDSPGLGGTVDRTRPFLKAELGWQLSRDTALKARFARDIRLDDIDDPLGEDVRTVGLALETALTEKLKLALAYEQARSDWLYYDYQTRTTGATATLSYTLAKGATVALEYSHLVRRETDEAAGFRVGGLAARFSGSF